MSAPRYFLRGGTDARNRVVDRDDPFRPDFETDDPAAFAAECKRRGLRPRYRTIDGKPARALTPHPKPRKVSFTSKPFDPTVGEVGSWVHAKGTPGLSVWNVRPHPVEGQVWAMSSERNHVWVVDHTGHAFHCHNDSLTPLHEPAEQPDMLTALQDAGRLEIVTVGRAS